MSISGTNEATQSVPFGGAPAVIPFTGSSAAGSASTPSRSDHTHGYDPPSVGLTHSTTQSLTSNTEATLTFDTESWDNDSMHAAGNPTRITFTTAGVYNITWGFSVGADNDYNWLYSYLRKNGTTIVGWGSGVGALTDNGWSPQSNGTATIKVSAADYVEVRAAQKNTSAGAATVSATIQFAATWIAEG